MKWLLILSVFNPLGLIQMSEDFKSEQLRYPRVRKAYQEKEAALVKLLREKDIEINDFNLFIRCFKQEQLVEVWVKAKDSTDFIHFKNYNFCSSSGDLGPKRKEGDGQIPEGFYTIDRFNPYSNFYLSLGVNYHNKSDRVLGDQQSPGGEIFIHGDCVTIGCIPITDNLIKELYVLAVEAKNGGQSRIPVHIFPFKFAASWQDGEHLSQRTFWTNLKQGYDYFDLKKQIPEIQIDNKGKYLFR